MPTPDIRVDVDDDDEDEEGVCFVCNKHIDDSDRGAIEPFTALHTCGCQPVIHPACYREWWLANGRCPQCNTESGLHDAVKFVIHGYDDLAAAATTPKNSLAYVGLVMLAAVGSVAAIAFGMSSVHCGSQQPTPPPHVGDDDDGWGIMIGVGMGGN